MTTTTAAEFGRRRKLLHSEGMLIDQPITADRVRAEGKQVGIAFGFDPAEPIEVTLQVGYTLLGQEIVTEWVFTRAMLAAGRTELVGGEPGTVAIAPKTKQFVEFALTDRQAGRLLLLSVERIDVDLAVDVFDHLAPMAGDPYVALTDAAFAEGVAKILRPPGGPR